MNDAPEPLDLKRVKVLPLAQRRSLSSINNIIVDPARPAPSCSPEVGQAIDDCAGRIAAARSRGASVILMYGAHLVKNGAMAIVISLMEKGWITHAATNGAGVIHDWELSFLGRTEESVRENIATGTFGTWDETGRNIHLALLAGGLRDEGFGMSLGRFIAEDGVTLPSPASLEQSLRNEPAHPLAPARAEVLQAMLSHHLPPGRIEVKHAWKRTSILSEAFRLKIPFTVHPGIGYDIFSNHPLFNGAAIGRAADKDFRLLGGSVGRLETGVVLSVGSAIMAPQVFEKTVSCANNLRLQDGQKILSGHSIYVVDIQDGGNWDWSKGEPLKSSPAYYLRFCKSFARMGGQMRYVQADNVTFLHRLLARMNPSGSNARP